MAPEGAIYNCAFLMSVGSRVSTGWYIHGAIFGALGQGYVTLKKETDQLVLESPSGEGIYDPSERGPTLGQNDLRDGLIAEEAADHTYGTSTS